VAEIESCKRDSNDTVWHKNRFNKFVLKPILKHHWYQLIAKIMLLILCQNVNTFNILC